MALKWGFQMKPCVINVEQAGRVAGISRGAAYQAAHRGDLPAVRFGRRLVVPVAKLAELLGLTAEEVASRAGASPGNGGPSDGSPA